MDIKDIYNVTALVSFLLAWANSNTSPQFCLAEDLYEKIEALLYLRILRKTKF